MTPKFPFEIYWPLGIYFLHKEAPSLKFIFLSVPKNQSRFEWRQVRKQYFKIWIDFYAPTRRIKLVTLKLDSSLVRHLDIEGVAQNLQLTKVCFKTISSRFFNNYFYVFHKTEVQTVILRCLTCLNLNWFKIYDTNEKHAKNARKLKKTLHRIALFTKSQTNKNGHIFFSKLLSQLRFRPFQHLKRTVWASVTKIVVKKRLEMVVKWTLDSCKFWATLFRIRMTTNLNGYILTNKANKQEIMKEFKIIWKSSYSSNEIRKTQNEHQIIYILSKFYRSVFV